MSKEISNSDDVIDSRDVIARIEELRDELANAQADGDVDARDAILAELTPLEELAAEGESSPDWQYGETLIRESYFKTYAQDLAEDIGAIDPNARWPLNCIDWDQAARELKMDYFSVDFDGVTYLIRA